MPSSQTSSMTARERRVRRALRAQSRSDACAPEVSPHGGPAGRDAAVASRLRRLDRLHHTVVVIPRAAPPGALTIQRP
jgi:hypothetical protein